MNVVFRVDASLDIGIGHVMRCLTLADALAAEGAICHFVCREHIGHMIETIRERGFSTSALPRAVYVKRGATEDDERQPAHVAWLGTSWQEDALQTHTAITELCPDWLVVDHYALDARWEEAVKPRRCRIFVIDDLADRLHACDILLDQNLGREAKDYSELIYGNCVCLIGPKYALLRPEFAQMRDASLARRAQPQLKNVLVTMGGVDKNNVTGTVLSALRNCVLPKDCSITVVMGANAPWLGHVKDQAASMPRFTDVVVDVTDMAERMCNTDLAIGAAGSTSWERCCLGVPTLIWVLAENQRQIARTLHAAEGAIQVSTSEELTLTISRLIGHEGREILQRISAAASNIVTGEGMRLVVSSMEKAAI